jgi:hypothetical protein
VNPSPSSESRLIRVRVIQAAVVGMEVKLANRVLVDDQRAVDVLDGEPALSPTLAVAVKVTVL